MAEPMTPIQVANDQETRAEADETPTSSEFWLGEIEAAKKREERWWKRGQAVIDRYRDERDKENSFEKRVNILWSNTEIMKASLFQGMGHPDVRRRFPKKGRQERAARQAAILIERALSYSQDAYDAESEIEAAVEDHLLPGRGVTWAVYEADVQDPEPVEPDPNSESDDVRPTNDNAAPEIVDQRIKLQHVYWRDFLTSYGRKWQDVWWVARRHLYSRDELRQYFPDHADKIPLGAEIEGSQPAKDAKDDTFKRAAVWEIWDKTKKQRVYVAEGYDLVLQMMPDPYRLQSFFPSQEPLYAIKTTGSLTPIPEYTLYQDQAAELDRIATRLDVMIDALKRRGVYDASMEGDDNKLSQLMRAGDNEFVPYKGFAALMEKGGLKNVFQTEDLAPIITVVEKLYEKSAICIQRIYEVTGISDVMRGATNPNETATAQRIKGNMGSLRLQKRQGRVQRFIRDGYRIKAEIIAEHFTREKLQEMTGIRLPLAAEVQQAQAILQQQAQAQQQPAPQMGHNGGTPMADGMPGPQQQPVQPPVMPMPVMMSPDMITEVQEIAAAVPWEEIEAILRSDQRRGYSIDIESDATAKMDDLEEKQARVEFMTAMESFMEKALPAALQLPPLMPLVKELTMFGVKTFKAGRPLEEAFEDGFNQLGQMVKQKQNQPTPPDPEQAKAQAEAEAMQMRTKAEADKHQMSMQAADQKHKQDMEAAAQKHQQAMEAKAAEMANKEREHRMSVELKSHDIRGKQMDMHNKQQSAAMDQHAKATEHQNRQDDREHEMAGKREAAAIEQEQQMRDAEAEDAHDAEESSKVDELAAAVADLAKSMDARFSQLMQALGARQ